MWSPVSFVGKRYEMDRGMIGINQDGTSIIESLDGTFDHHVEATMRIADKFKIIIENTISPFEAAINCSNKGIVILQTDGDKVFLYLPEQISNEQHEKILGIVSPRNTFDFSFIHGEMIFEHQNYDAVLAYLHKIIDNVNSLRRIG